MMDPPSRNAMWRLGFSNPINYNDNEVFCGGVGGTFEMLKLKLGQLFWHTAVCNICSAFFSHGYPKYVRQGTHRNLQIYK